MLTLLCHLPWIEVDECRRSRGRISIGPAEPTLVTDRMFDMILWHKAKGVMRGSRKTFLFWL